MAAFPARRSGPQQGVMRLCAVWTCRSGWVTVARQGFPLRVPWDGPARGGRPSGQYPVSGRIGLAGSVGSVPDVS
jgi:hypothetical protein